MAAGTKEVEKYLKKAIGLAAKARKKKPPKDPKKTWGGGAGVKAAGLPNTGGSMGAGAMGENIENTRKDLIESFSQKEWNYLLTRHLLTNKQ